MWLCHTLIPILQPFLDKRTRSKHNSVTYRTLHIVMSSTILCSSFAIAGLCLALKPYATGHTFPHILCSFWSLYTCRCSFLPLENLPSF